MFCSVGRMFTIAQNAGTPTNDGSCFGACQGVPTARWDEVVMGEIVSPCANNPGSPPSATCTIEYPSNGMWQNGANYSCDGETWSEYNQQDGLEGINTSHPGCSTTNASQKAFKAPLPLAPSSPCTADSKSFCSIQMSKTQSGACDTGFKNVHGGEIMVYAYTTSYDTFKQSAMLEFQGTATEEQSVPSYKPCTITTRWSPAEPRVTYNDPNLP